MTNKLSVLLIVICLPFIIQCKESPSGLSDKKEDAGQEVDVFEQNKLLGRGINLGNALEAPNEGDWGIILQEEYFDIIRDAGFSSVRIPIRWSAHTTVDSPFTISTKFFERIDWAVDQSLNAGLAVVINIHHFEEIFSDPYANKKKFLEIWRQIADRYKSYSSNLFFEVLNEPHDQLNEIIWNEFLAEAMDIIRTSNPNRTAIIGTANWGGVSALNQLVLPENENNIIVTIHYYEPFHFTHQGAEWSEGSSDWLGTQWTGTVSEERAIKDHFDNVKAWADSRNVPIYMGEFGAYYKADMDSRERWTAFTARQAEMRNFSWAYWEFCSGFGAFNKDKNEWHRQLLRALLPND